MLRPILVFPQKFCRKAAIPRILFLCVINEIIMKVKLNKILFLNLCFGCVFFMWSLVCKADIDDIQIRPSVGVKIDGNDTYPSYHRHPRPMECFDLS
jgi:hypothetical protein